MMILSTSAVADQPIRVKGWILEKEGKQPLAGAKVELIPAYQNPEELSRDPVPIASTQTAGNGFFELAAPGSGCYKVIVRSDGYLSEEHPLVPLVEDTELFATYLEKPLPLKIRTLGLDGKALSGVEIFATSEPHEVSSRLEPWTWWVADRRGTTGEGGTLFLPSVRSEKLKLIATSPRFAHSAHLEAGPEQAGPVILRLSPREVPGRSPEPPRILVGTVVDAASGLPVPGAVVWSGNPLNAPPVRSGADGSFRLEAPAAAEVFWVDAAAEGYLLGERRLVSKQETGPIRLALDRAAALSGVVVDGEGKPVPGALIESAPWPKRSLSLLQSQGKVRTGPDGRFLLKGLLPLGDYELFAARQGFARTRATARTAAPGKPAQEVRIVLDSGRTAFGRVVDEAGRPVAGAALLMLARARGAGTERHETSSDETGRFKFRGVSPGLYNLLIERQGFPQLSLSGIRVPAETQTADLGAIDLLAGATMEGRVTDIRGLPLSGAEVWAYPSSAEEEAAPWILHEEEWEDPVRTTTGEDGSFRVEDLKRGKRFLLHIAHPGYVEASLPEVEVPTAGPLRIELRMARTFAGRVVGPEGEPVTEAWLSQVLETRTGSSSGWGRSGSRRHLGSTDPEGRFRCTEMSPGVIDLEVSAKGYRPKRLNGFSIPEDRDIEGFEIVLDRSAILKVKVVTASGEPVVQAWVMAYPETPADEEEPRRRHFWDPRNNSTDKQGVCLVEVPKPGRYRAYASLQEDSAGAEGVEVGPAGSSIELRLQKGTKISGRVTDEDGLGVAGATISLESVSSMGGLSIRDTLSDADGSFTLSGVEDSTIRLKANKKGYAETIYPEEVIVAGRSIHGIEIRLVKDETYGMR